MTVKKTILVTGSEGFIGKRLVSKLNELGYSTIGMDYLNGYDLEKPIDNNAVGDFDNCVHLAAKSFVPDSYKNPEEFYAANFLSTLNALSLCRKRNKRLIFISSYVYGIPEYLPLDENHPLGAYNPYAQSKIICENICVGYNRDFRIPIIILRPFNIYGAGQNANFLIASIFEQIKNNRDIILLKDPNPKRDYVYVDDLVSAIISAIVSDKQFGIYNICSGESYSVREITEMINRNLKNKVKFLFDENNKRIAEIKDTLGSNQKIKNELGWSVKYSFEQGICKIIAENGLN